MSEFEFFFTFYGLVLGLAAAEVLNGLGGVVRARRLSHVGVQTALLTTVLMLVICVTWIDAWKTLRDIEISLRALALPLLIAGCYYLAAIIVFPKDLEAWASLDAYYAERKRYAAVLMLVAEVLVLITAWHTVALPFAENPKLFWRWTLPYNVLIHGSLVALVFVRGRRWNVITLSVLLFLYALPYWSGGWGTFLASL